MHYRQEDMSVGKRHWSVYGLSRRLVLWTCQAWVSPLPLRRLSWQR